jgi:hypothetical protein
MKRALVISLLAIPLVFGILSAGEEAKKALIKLDMEWGESGVTGDTAVLGRILADDLMSLDGSGVSTKADQIKAAESAEPVAGPYSASDFKVMFVKDDIAVMTHSVSGEDAHRSMHIWANRDGNWQVVATATVPMAEAAPTSE